MSLADSLRESDGLNAEEAEELIAFFMDHFNLDLSIDSTPRFQARKIIDLEVAAVAALSRLCEAHLILPDSPELSGFRRDLVGAYLRLSAEAYLSTQALHVLNYVSRGAHRIAHSRMLSMLREADRRKADFSLLPHELRSMVYDRN